MIMEKIFQVDTLDKHYEVKMSLKRQRNIYLRHNKGVYSGSAPFFVSNHKIQDFLNKNLPILIRRVEKKSQFKSAPIGDGYTYFFGEKVEENFSKDFLKAKLLDELTKMVRSLENKMQISKPYKVKVKDMSSRFGSNSFKTHSLNFQLSLVHYSPEIIYSVVVHELAHEFYRDHQRHFYNLVLNYCPNYYELNRKLKRGIYR